MMKGLCVGLLLLLLGVTATAHATLYFIDGSCANNGNGTGDNCAASGGASGAYQDPQSCMTVMVAGDTCYVKNGTYTTTNVGSDTRTNGGYYFAHSGTVGSRITLKNYTGHTPTLKGCANPTVTECAHPTITANFRDYITIDGLTIVGALYWLCNSGNACDGFIVQNSDLSCGWDDDGNWSPLRMEWLNAPYVYNNYIHDIAAPSVTSFPAYSMLKLYSVRDGIVEYNTLDNNVTTRSNDSNGIDDKESSISNIHRYNYIKNVATGIRFNNQNSSRGTATGSVAHHNVFVSSGVAGNRDACVVLLLGINSVSWYNNTCYGFGPSGSDGGNILLVENTITGVTHYNNLYAAAPIRNIQNYLTPNANFTLADYNVYTASKPYRMIGTTYTSLATYQSGTGLDAASHEYTCTFVSAPTNLRLNGGSCVGAGRVGGLSSGAAIDVGAYDGVTCVGSSCADATPPAIPTNVRVSKAIHANH